MENRIETINKQKVLMKQINVVFNADVLANGAFKTTARSGVYFVAYNILIEMLNRQELNVKLIYNTKQAHMVEKVLNSDNQLCKIPVIKYSGLDNSIAHYEKLKYESKQNKGNSFIRAGIKLKLNILKLVKKINVKLNFDKHYVEELHDIDVFFSPWGLVPQEVKRNKNIKNYILVHDVIPLIFPENFPEIKKKKSDFYKLFHSFNAETFYFANSHYTKQDLLKHAKEVLFENVTVTPLSTGAKYEKTSDKILIESVKEKYNIPKEKKYIFSLCSLEPRKNLIFAVKNFINFIRKNNIEDFVFVLGGGNWDIFIEKLNQTISDLEGFKDKIIKIGYVDDDDMSALYSGADMFVFPSIYEGFGMPILEAMKCGCPVICSNVASMPEVIGDCGIQISPNDDEDLIKAFEKMYFDDTFKKECIEKGLKRAENFSWEKCVDIIINEIAKGKLIV